MAKDTKYIRKRKRKYGAAYLVDIPYKDENGESKHFTQTVKVAEFGSDQKALLAAQKIRNDALQDIAAGKFRTVFPTVGYLYNRKFDLMPMAISTKAKQDSIYSHSIEVYKDIPIDKITIADIQACVNKFAQDHSDDGVQRCLSIWRQLYKAAAILECNVSDKTTGVVLPKSKYVVQHKSVDLEDGEFQKISDALIEIGDYDAMGIYFLLQIMFFTGCRPAEALALRRSDIHDKYITVNKQIGSTYTERLQEVPTKTAKSFRKIPVPIALVPILNDLLSWSQHDLLLANADGSVRDINLISDFLMRLSRRIGVHFFLYKLRHQMSTDLISAGDPIAARDILGHSSFSMSLDYARSTDDQLYEAINNRRPAEKQPKNESHSQPQTAMIRHYQIMRLNTAFRLVLLIKSGIF